MYEAEVCTYTEIPTIAEILDITRNFLFGKHINETRSGGKNLYLPIRDLYI